jgi:hypothetical protein
MDTFNPKHLTSAQIVSTLIAVALLLVAFVYREQMRLGGINWPSWLPPQF